MGKYGKEIGSAIGGALGNAGGDFVGEGKCGRQVGTAAGNWLGGLLPFKKGGRVRKTGPIYAHKGKEHGNLGMPPARLTLGEYILPRGVAPTKAQRAKVAKKHRK